MLLICILRAVCQKLSASFVSMDHWHFGGCCGAHVFFEKENRKRKKEKEELHT